MNSWSTKSQNAYDTLQLDLKVMCDRVLYVHDCSILYGYRNMALQNSLYAIGTSTLRYPDSNHNSFPSNAVDLIPYRKGFDPYGDDMYVTYFAGLVLGIAEQLYHDGKMKQQIRWGGNWSVERNIPFASFFDAYHFELF